MQTHALNMAKPNTALKGIGLMVLMTVCFSSLDATAKYIGGDLSLWTVIWGRYLFHFLFITLFLSRHISPAMFRTRRIGLQILRPVLIFLAGATFWASLMFMPLAECTAIAFASPFLVAVLSVFFLGERVGRHRWLGVAVGFAGVLIVVRPGATTVQWIAFLPLVAALFYGASQIVTRALGGVDHALTTLFFSSIGGVLLSSAIVGFSWSTPSPTQWLGLVGLGFFGATGHYFMIKAFELAPASLLAPFDYLNLIWATIFGFLVFGDLPDGRTIIGSAIVILSGIYLIKREKNAVPSR